MHLGQSKQNPKIKHIIYMFNNDDKIIKEIKYKVIKKVNFKRIYS